MANQGEFTGAQVMSPPPVDGPSRAMVASGPPPGALAMPSFAPRGPEILVGGFNQTWLMNCLRRRWLMASLMGLLIGGGTAGMLMWLIPESSRVTTYLEVKSEDASSPFDETRRPVNQLQIQREAAMHPALIKSPLVLEAVVIRDDIANLDAIQYHRGEEVLWLLNDLKVTFAAESPILELKYEGEENPEDMVKIVNAVVESYKDKVLMQDQLTRAATREDLAGVLKTVQQDLQNRFGELQTETTLNGRGNEEIELQKLKADVSLCQQQLISVDRELMDIEVLKNVSLLRAQSLGSLESAVTAEMDKDPTIAMYKQELFLLNQQIQSVQSSARNAGNPQLRRLQAQYQQTEQAMDTYRMTASKDVKERLAKIPNEDLQAAIVEYRVRSEALHAKKKDLEKTLKEAEARIAEMSIVDPEIEMLKQDIESQQELVRTLNQKILEWDVERRGRDVRTLTNGKKDTEYEKIQVIQDAIATEKINTTERYAIAGVGGLAALALTCYGVALIEFRRRRLNSPRDIDEGLGVRVLGVLPPASLKTIAGNSLTSTQVAEAIDNVRATIMHDSTSRPRQVVMVTSPATMEGCTTVAASLALSLARAGRRTLLIDGDLRSPSLHKLFGLPLEDGLSEVLRSEIDLADAVRPTSSEGLHLLTAGVSDMDAIHALATDQPQAIFDKLRDQFDFVVIDSPPVLGISDALSLGQYVDGAVLTVLRDHSEIRRVYQAIETLRTMGVRVIGSVVNGVPTKADRRMVRLHQATQQRQARLPAAPAASE